MKIALVSPEFAHTRDGGLANYTYRIAKYLIDLGHSVTVVIPSSETKKLDYKGVEVHEVEFKYVAERSKGLKKIFGKSSSPLYTYFDERSKCIHSYLSQLQATEKFNVIHYSHLGGLGKHRIKKVASVVRLSSSTRLCHEQGGYGESYSEMEQQERIESEAIKSADLTFGPSSFIANYVQDQTSTNVEVLETPFEPNLTLKPDSTVFENTVTSDKYILYFGSLVKLKGVETLANCILPFLENNLDYEFIFVGKSIKRQNGEDMQDYLQSVVKADMRVKFTGALTQEQLVPFISNATFITLPSLVDNFPNTCLESMYRGKIVIGTKRNGFEQLIENGVSGFLVSPGDEEELLNSMNLVATLSENEKKIIGENASNRIKELNPEAMVNQLVELYQKAIDKCAE